MGLILRPFRILPRLPMENDYEELLDIGLTPNSGIALSSAYRYFLLCYRVKNKLTSLNLFNFFDIRK